MMIRILSLAMLIVTLVSCSGQDSSERASATAQAGNSSTPPANVTERFITRDINGQLRSWSEFYGKPVVINFWATWCGPCRMEMPILKELYKEFHPQGLEIIGISLDMPNKSRHMVVPFINQNEIPWVIIYADQKIAQEFELGQSIPMTVFINAEGKETGRITGAQPHDVFRKEFEKMFN